MRNFNEFTITNAVMDRLKDVKDARTHQISAALVRHLHAFIREVEPTFAEWEAGIDFLTRTGRFCDDKRQEFILLSDTLGVSMLTVALNNDKPPGAGIQFYGPSAADRAAMARSSATIRSRSSISATMTSRSAAENSTPSKSASRCAILSATCMAASFNCDRRAI